MAKKKPKSPSFDAMVKFFMSQHNIATKQDIAKLIEKIDRLEKFIKGSSAVPGRIRRADKTIKSKGQRNGTSVTASEAVLQTIKEFKDGASFADIQAKTGFEEKKVRNIIYRLTKTKKIRRRERGIYIVS